MLYGLLVAIVALGERFQPPVTTYRLQSRPTGSVIVSGQDQVDSIGIENQFPRFAKGCMIAILGSGKNRVKRSDSLSDQSVARQSEDGFYRMRKLNRLVSPAHLGTDLIHQIFNLNGPSFQFVGTCDQRDPESSLIGILELLCQLLSVGIDLRGITGMANN